MAIAKFAVKYFKNAHDLQVFALNEATVASITAIVYDTQSNKFVLFYITT